MKPPLRSRIKVAWHVMRGLPVVYLADIEGIVRIPEPEIRPFIVYGTTFHSRSPAPWDGMLRDGTPYAGSGVDEHDWRL